MTNLAPDVTRCSPDIRRIRKMEKRITSTVVLAAISALAGWAQPIQKRDYSASLEIKYSDLQVEISSETVRADLALQVPVKTERQVLPNVEVLDTTDPMT